MSKQLRVEVRAAQDGSKAIEGYAAVFNRLSEDLGGFREQITPGAFTRALSGKPDVLCLVDHDSSRLLGRTASGTCTVEQDDNGLKFRCDLPNTREGNDLHEMVKRGDISQCSFSFSVDSDDWAEVTEEGDEEKSFIRRTVTGVRSLFDASPVVKPAYPQTSVKTA
jgi:HK97 family phage prohead protease